MCVMIAFERCPWDETRVRENVHVIWCVCVLILRSCVCVVQISQETCCCQEGERHEYDGKKEAQGTHPFKISQKSGEEEGQSVFESVQEESS